METNPPERRNRRSNDTRTALTYQLDCIRHAAELEAVVLADAAGLSLAASGDELVCAELAALSPIAARREGTRSTHCRSSYVHVRAVTVEGVPLFLASCGDGPAGASPAHLEGSLAEAERGVARILAA